MRGRSKLGRVVAGVVLAGAILAGPLGVGQAHAAGIEQFSGMGTGYALRVTLDLRPLVAAVPAEVRGQLQGVLNQVFGAVGGSAGEFGLIDQYIIRTTSDANNAVTKARSALAEGLVDLDVVEATNVGQVVEKTVQDIQLPSADLPLISGDIGNLRAAVVGGPNVDGKGVFNELNVQLPLDDLPGVGDLLELKVDELVGQLEDVLGSVIGDTPADGVLGDVGEDLVGDLTGTIGGLTGSLPAGQLEDIAGGLGLESPADLEDPAAVTDALTDLIDGLTTTLTDLLGNLELGDLASIQDLVNTTNAFRAADGSKAVADSVASLASLDVLGGLVDVGLFNLKSHSEAAGVPGSAKNSSSCSLADVNLGQGAFGISLDGKTLTLNGTEVPAVGDAVGTLKGIVDQVLATLGIKVALCDVAQTTAEPDGTAAAQRVSALRVEVAPLDLFSLVIDPTVETAVAANQPQAQVKGPEPTLPKTGAPIVATVLSGIAVAGGALILRRRFF